MSNYRRWRVNGGTYFFTIVTYRRRPVFADATARRFLRESINDVRERLPFEIPAIVLLPDHLHMMMHMPGEHDYSNRIRQIKTLFTRRLAKVTDTKAGVSKSRTSRGEHAVWQRRFYEHTVRDEEDYQRCADYIHINPVKHGLVERVVDWPWSSFHSWLANGFYEPGWGNGEWFGDEFKKFE